MKRIGILVVAYNAATTLAKTLDRIPEDFRPRIDAILVSDDHSDDDTYLIGLGYQQQSNLPITVIRTHENLGYGGNQKLGYRWAIENNLDIVVLLHGDGQYAPELLPDIVAPLEAGSADAVFGSRMMERGRARKGGMPLYKYVGNKILTRMENAVAGANLSEWHSGYRAYATDALADIPFERNDDGFNFDTQIIVQMLEAGKRIKEIPIPTYYGDEISYVNGLVYAKDITNDVLRYRLHKMGFGTGELAFASNVYETKVGAHSSHAKLLDWANANQPLKILDLGCSDGVLSEHLTRAGHSVTAVDIEAHPNIATRCERFVKANLDLGIPDEINDQFDLVLAADVLEHVRNPERLLEDAKKRLAPGGRILVSVPNFGHWYPRFRTLLGVFDYDRRGILDVTHVRFFTKRSFLSLASRSGLKPVRFDSTGLPLEVKDRGAAKPNQGGQPDTSPQNEPGRLTKADRLLASIWPTMFGYQFLFELVPE